MDGDEIDSISIIATNGRSVDEQDPQEMLKVMSSGRNQSRRTRLERFLRLPEHSMMNLISWMRQSCTNPVGGRSLDPVRLSVGGEWRARGLN